MFHAKFQIAGNVLELPFIDVAKMALLWQKDGPHIVLRICSSSILINLLRDVLCQISHCWVYPVASFPRNSQNMSLLWPKQGPHMVLQIGSS